MCVCEPSLHFSCSEARVSISQTRDGGGSGIFTERCRKQHKVYNIDHAIPIQIRSRSEAGSHKHQVLNINNAVSVQIPCKH